MRAAAACSADTPGTTESRYAVPLGSVLGVEQLEDQGGQGLDAGVPRRHQGDGAPLGGQIEGLP